MQVVLHCLCLCVLLTASFLLWHSRPKTSLLLLLDAKPRLSQGLRVVPLRLATDFARTHGDAPFFVVGFPPTPPASEWSRWGVTQANVLRSPSGVFGAYGACEKDAVLSPEGGVRFVSSRCRSDERCVPQHALFSSSLSDALDAFAAPKSSFVYVRAQVPLEQLLVLEHEVDMALESVSLYLSSAGCVTNLHWDGHSGFLAQTRGEKEVQLFAPGRMPAPAPAGSPCSRRSYHCGRECPRGAFAKLRLQAGWALYIPTRWAHHVTSLSAESLGAVWRPVTDRADARGVRGAV